MKEAAYIHGTDASEQTRLAGLNRLTNRSFVQFLNPHPDARVLEVGSGLGLLRPSGQVFVQENNILVNELWPECPRFSALWRKFAEVQSRLGGDALIGKKLFALLRTAGFGEIQLSLAPEIHPAHCATFSTWIENLIGNVRSGQSALLASGLATAEEIAAAIAELQEFARLPEACAYFYWNRAQAVR
jgi:hypothetical protein